MKILLLNPPYTFVYGRYRHAAKVGVCWSPTGLAYLGEVLIRKGHQVRIIDLEVDNIPPNELISRIKRLKPDIVGITSQTPTHHVAMQLFELIKKANNSIITFCGGPHATSLPMETIKNCKYIDYLCFGECEITIVELVDAIETNKDLSKIQGIYYRDKNKIKITPKRPLITNLDEIPFPARYLLKNDEYLWSVPKKGIMPVTTFMTSRGCPYRCSFCSERVIFGQNMRFRSTQNVIDELNEIRYFYGIKHLIVLDDTLGVNRKKFFDVCDAIKKEKIDITFEGTTRVNLVDREFLRKFKSAGLNRISFGVESGNQHILDAIKKDITLDQIRKAYKIAFDLGIETRMSVILGLPFETEQTIRKTIKFIKSLKCMQTQINIATPFPGTEFYDMAKKGYGGMKLLTDDWMEYRRWGNAVISVNDLSKEDLIKWQRKALLQFYSTPDRVIYNLRRAGPKAAVRNIKAFFKSLF